MTLEEAKEIAQLVVSGHTRSHVDAAAQLAKFILTLHSVRPMLPLDSGLSAQELIDELED